MFATTSTNTGKSNSPVTVLRGMHSVTLFSLCLSFLENVRDDLFQWLVFETSTNDRCSFFIMKASRKQNHIKIGYPTNFCWYPLPMYLAKTVWCRWELPETYTVNQAPSMVWRNSPELFISITTSLLKRFKTATQTRSKKSFPNICMKSYVSLLRSLCSIWVFVYSAFEALKPQLLITRKKPIKTPQNLTGHNFSTHFTSGTAAFCRTNCWSSKKPPQLNRSVHFIYPAGPLWLCALASFSTSLVSLLYWGFLANFDYFSTSLWFNLSGLFSGQLLKTTYRVRNAFFFTFSTQWRTLVFTNCPTLRPYSLYKQNGVTTHVKDQSCE